jgi:YgiT-type zinc finger domain-containing protein
MRTCTHCHLGNLHRQAISYANWHDGRFIVVPNMPAWRCDVCADYEVDVDALNRLLPLIGPVTQPDLDQARHGWRSGAESPRDEVDPDRSHRQV